MTIRIIKHEAVPQIASLTAAQAIYFYWDDNPGRQSITLSKSQEEAERTAKELARAEQEKLQ
jgi:hypothetical protein